MFYASEYYSYRRILQRCKIDHLLRWKSKTGHTKSVRATLTKKFPSDSLDRTQGAGLVDFQINRHLHFSMQYTLLTTHNLSLICS